jgi:hypothetical protein
LAEPTDSGRPNPAINAEREALLKVLVDHDVQFVVIGGAGIESHDCRYDTLDLDVTPDRDEANLRRLADALNELECRLVTDPANAAAWVPLPPDYFMRRRHSHCRARGCLDDIDKSKRAADRPKDRVHFLAAGEPGRE